MKIEKWRYSGKRMLVAMAAAAMVISGCGKPPVDKVEEEKEEEKVSVFKGVTEQFIGAVSDAKGDYDVVVNISGESVGVSIEDVKKGFLYLGTEKKYKQEKSGAALVTVKAVNTRGEAAAGDSKTIELKYDAKTVTLEVVKFGAAAQKRKLTLVGRSEKEGKARRYTVAMKEVPYIGEAIVSVVIKERHVTAQVVQNGAVPAVYRGVGVVKDGEMVEVKVPVDNKDIAKAKQIVYFEGHLLNGKLSDVKASVASHLEDKPLVPHVMPLFKPLHIPFTAVTSGSEPDVKGELILTAKQSMVDGEEGYYMSAQFRAWKMDGTHTTVAQSAVVEAKGEPTGKKTNTTWTTSSHPHQYGFKLKGFKSDNAAHGLFQDGDLAIEIEKWQPIALTQKDGKTPLTGGGANVTTGGFNIKINSSASSPKTILKGAFKVTTSGGSATYDPSSDVSGYANIKVKKADGTDVGLTTVNGTASVWLPVQFEQDW